jgi:large subunit ribosomal protein L4
MKLTTYTKTGNKSKTPLEVSNAVFNAEVNQILLAQGIRVYLANQRQGTSKVKTRSAVARTTKKWLQQKGTGRARHGSRNAPIFVGGGIAHGPTGLANWKLKLTKRSKTQSLVAALSAQKDNIVACDGFNELSGKTKQAVELLSKMADQKEKVLIILTKPKPEVIKSLRNLQKVLVTQVERLNIYEVALADKIIITSDAVKQLEEKLAKYIKIVKRVNKKGS